jgi:hypothetical protein
MMISFTTFGILVGITAAAWAVVAGGGVFTALLAYSIVGTLGLLSMALLDPWTV